MCYYVILPMFFSQGFSFSMLQYKTLSKKKRCKISLTATFCIYQQCISEVKYSTERYETATSVRHAAINLTFKLVNNVKSIKTMSTAITSIPFNV